MGDPANWAVQAGGFANQRSSDLEKINAANLGMAAAVIDTIPHHVCGIEHRATDVARPMIACDAGVGGSLLSIASTAGALCAMRVGGPAAAYSSGGMYGPIESILYPIHHGIFRILGFGVLPPSLGSDPLRLPPQQALADVS
jgi:hypothetical protein